MYLVFNEDQEEATTALTLEEVLEVLKDKEWDISEVYVYELPSPLSLELKLVLKTTVVKKER